MPAGKLLTWLGALCVVVGLGLTVYQMLVALPGPGEMHIAGLGAGRFGFETHYPGLIVMAIGAVMMLAGEVSRRRSN